jgi:orotidine-5'-phosphate decarboxylase
MLKIDRKERVILALDVENPAKARELIEATAETIAFYKVGMQLFTAAGPVILDLLAKRGKRVFLDLKYHDIPNTVACAVHEATRLGVAMVNIHALGGGRMMRQARSAAGENLKRPYLLAVTILTSLDGEELKNDLLIDRPLSEVVLHLAGKAHDAGLDGVVASAEEVVLLRKTFGDGFLIVTPGIRPHWAKNNDQKRTLTPKEAFDRGADYIVVGRPITQAQDPGQAARRLMDEIN